MTGSIDKRSVAGRTVFGLALAVILMSGFAAPALADRDDRGGRGYDREWQEHEVRARHWHRVHPVVVPGYVYAPPPVVYAPPPPPPGISLIIPLRIN